MENYKIYGTIDKCISDIELNYRIWFTLPLIGTKTNLKLYNKGFTIGETTEDKKHYYRVDYDLKLGMHINFYSNKDKYHFIIAKNVIEDYKHEIWIGLAKKYKYFVFNSVKIFHNSQNGKIIILVR